LFSFLICCLCTFFTVKLFQFCQGVLTQSYKKRNKILVYAGKNCLE
jgi:hypothetical protein